MEAMAQKTLQKTKDFSKLSYLQYNIKKFFHYVTYLNVQFESLKSRNSQTATIISIRTTEFCRCNFLLTVTKN